MAYKFQRGTFTTDGSYTQDGGNITAQSTYDITALALALVSAGGGSGDLNCATLSAAGGGISFTQGDSATDATAVQIQDGSNNAVVDLSLDTNTDAQGGVLRIRKAAATKLALGVAEDADALKGGTAYSSYLQVNDSGGSLVISAFGQTGALIGKKLEIGTGVSTCDNLIVSQNCTVNGSLVQMNVANGVLIASKVGRLASGAANLANSVDSGFNICTDGAHANGGAFRYVTDADLGNEGHKVVDGRHFAFAKKNGNAFDADFAGNVNLPDSRLASVKASVFYGDGDEVTNLPTTSVTTHTANATLTAGGMHLVDLATAGANVTLTLPDGDTFGNGAGGHIFMFKIISVAASQGGGARKLVIAAAGSNVILEEGGDVNSINVESDYAGVSLIQGAGSQAEERKWSIH